MIASSEFSCIRAIGDCLYVASEELVQSSIIEANKSLQYGQITQQRLCSFLRRVLGKIFNDLEIKGWCRE